MAIKAVDMYFDLSDSSHKTDCRRGKPSRIMSLEEKSAAKSQVPVARREERCALAGGGNIDEVAGEYDCIKRRP